MSRIKENSIFFFFYVFLKKILVLSNMYKIKKICAKLYQRGDTLLEIYNEFRKGILFIRLSGEFTKNTYQKHKSVNNMIIDNGIKKVVFNLDNLNLIDKKGINCLLYSYELVKINKGECFICGINKNIRKKIEKSSLLNYLIEIDNELSTFSIV